MTIKTAKLASRPKTSKTPRTPKSNVFKYTGGSKATRVHEGIHTATIVSTEYVGEKATKYGLKEFQNFVFEVKQTNDDGVEETLRTSQQFTRSLHPTAALTKFLSTGFPTFEIKNDTIDFDELVGKRVRIVVTNGKKNVNGGFFKNVQALPPEVFEVTPDVIPPPAPGVSQAERAKRRLLDAQRKYDRLLREYGENEPITQAAKEDLARAKSEAAGGGSCAN